MGVSATDSIIIVGAGALGLSAALHLARRGYKNVSVFDKNHTLGDLTNVVYPQNPGLFQKKQSRRTVWGPRFRIVG